MKICGTKKKKKEEEEEEEDKKQIKSCTTYIENMQIIYEKLLKRHEKIGDIYNNILKHISY